MSARHCEKNSRPKLTMEQKVLRILDLMKQGKTHRALRLCGQLPGSGHFSLEHFRD
jgi:hypothetical protein